MVLPRCLPGTTRYSVPLMWSMVPGASGAMVTGVRNWLNQMVQSVPAGGFSMVRVWSARPVSGSVSPSVQLTTQGWVQAAQIAHAIIKEGKLFVLTISGFVS